MSKLKLMTIIGTRPEIIRLAAVIKRCDRYFDQILVHIRAELRLYIEPGDFLTIWGFVLRTIIWMR